MNATHRDGDAWPDGHPPVEQLVAHAARPPGDGPSDKVPSGKEPSDAGQRALDEHLARCPDCRMLVAEADAFGAEEPEHAVEWRARRGDAWRRLHDRLAEETPFPTPELHRTAEGATHRAGPRGWLSAAALAGLVCGLVGLLGGWWLGQHGTPDAPVLAPPVVDLFPPSYYRGAEATRPTVPTAPLVVLELHVDPPADLADGRFVDYRLQLLDVDDAVLWSADSARPTELGGFRVALPGRLLPAGSYRLEVLGLATGTATESMLGSFAFDVVKSDATQSDDTQSDTTQPGG
ncbi:MAG: hypothetical protein AAGC60_08975 [Acidobacteriota bacterium]